MNSNPDRDFVSMSEQASSSGRLLVVDQTPGICNALVEALPAGKYEVQMATSLEDAMSIIGMRDIDVVLAGREVGALSGIEFLGRVREKQPATVRLAFGIQGGVQEVARGMDAGDIHQFLSKPWDDQLLREGVEEAFHRAKSIRDSRESDPVYRNDSGLPGLRYLLDRWPDLVAKARGEGGTVCCLAFQLDQYEAIRKEHGGELVDALMREGSARLQRSLGHGCVLARIADDRFALLSKGFDPTARVMVFKQLVDDCFFAPISIDRHQFRLTFSYGAAVAADDSVDAKQLIDQACSAMNVVSSSGTAGIQVYGNLQEADLRRLQMIESGLRDAIELGAIRVVYQPQVDVGTGLIVGVEALARWEHPELGWVSPAEFIPMAQKLGLVNELGAAVMGRAVDEFGTWTQGGLHPGELSINVFGEQLLHPSFSGLVEDLLGKGSIGPEHLVLEFGEREALALSRSQSQTFDRLRSMGVSLAVDDLGKTSSDLSQFAELPFGKAKVDQSLIRMAVEQGKRREFLRHFVSAALDENVQVSFKGIETPGELLTVQESGCSLMQGYFFSPPLAPVKLEPLLGKDRLWSPT